MHCFQILIIRADFLNRFSRSAGIDFWLPTKSVVTLHYQGNTLRESRRRQVRISLGNAPSIKSTQKPNKAMSIFYRLYQNNSENFVNKGKWYARSVVMGKMVGLEELAEHMAEHNTPYSEGIIKGVLTDMINCIRELVLDGKAVKIPNLCIFSAGIQSKPADTVKDFSVQQHVKGVYLRTRTTGKFTRDEITKKANLRELSKYDVG